MRLASGTRLGPYKIASQLGVGGMGEVYRATDTSLGRDVAVKVLPAAFASDEDRVARFEREARTLACLNHPNIAAVYGLERSGETLALVMELVTGPTLADSIAGPMPPDKAMHIARQVAYALEAAHEQGIVHRDLKPANIKVRADGTVKVLDFGLAKSMLDDPQTDRLSTESPTIVSPALTQTGVILGTAAYMSPEQATARFVDKRSDIWAFGCVLYEMVTGRRAFEAPTVTETLALILERDVDWTKVPATTPPRVTTVLRRALEKDPRNRLHDIADARIELEDARTLAPPVDRAVPRRTWPLALAAVAVSLLAATAAWSLKPTSIGVPATNEVIRLAVTPELPLSADSQGIVALSPDGRSLAYVAVSNGRPQLFLRRLDRFEGTPVPGTEGADNIAFSPDGNWIAFAADRKIKRVATGGGPPIVVCEFAEGLGLSWESNDAILFNPGRASGIFRVAAVGGTPSVVTKLRVGDTEHQSPDALPGGKALLYNTRVGGNNDNSQIYAESLETGERNLVARGSGARYIATGHVVYADGSSLFAVPFDRARLVTTGKPIALQGDVRLTPAAIPQFAISTNGSMAYVPAVGTTPKDTLVWVDRKGIEQPTSLSDTALTMPRLSPDGKRVAMLLGGGNGTQGGAADLWSFDLARNNARSRLTFDSISSFPLWSPEGTRFAYSTGLSGRYEIHVRTVDGLSDDKLSSTEGTNYPLSWSPDGRSIATVSVSPTTANDIWIYTLGQPPTSHIFLQTRFREGAPTFSPDGNWLAYASDQSGRNEIYMRPVSRPGQEVTISTDGGSEPLFASLAGQLFYRHGNAMMAVAIKTTPSVEIGTPQRLFEGRYNGSAGFWPNYAVTRDGQRLLMIKGTGLEAPTQIRVVLNWFSDLNRLVPITKK
jgi:eukaryotic-like serine/threonine-protein kinase